MYLEGPWGNLGSFHFRSTMLNLARVDLDRIYPPLVAAIKQIEIPESYYATSGLRSFHDQGILYAQGRTAPGSIITQAKAGQSPHNYGIAIDFTRDKDVVAEGLQPDWSSADVFKPLADAAVAVGLEAGYYWKWVDPPHIQWHIDCEWSDLIEISQGGIDIKAVWDYLDSVR